MANEWIFATLTKLNSEIFNLLKKDIPLKAFTRGGGKYIGWNGNCNWDSTSYISELAFEFQQENKY